MKDEGAPQFRSEFVVLPVFFLASLWIQVHLITADLLVAMFLVCSICSMIKNRVAMDYRHLLLIAFLAAFAGWTKPTALPYIALMILLWFPLRFVQWNPKKIVFFYMVILILLSPLFLRNYLITGDPLYPTLSKNSPNWSDKQQLALAADISAPKINPLSRLFKVPIEIIYAPYKYGSAAEVGILYAVSLIVYLFFWKSHPITNRLLIFLFLCYVFWIFVFRDFRQFFPVFLLIHIPCSIALSDLFIQKKWVSVIILLASAFFSVHLILPVFQNHMPVISIKQSQRKYLEQNLDYYPFAIWTEFVQTNGKILMLGESRTAYLHLPVLTSTPFDKHPFFFWLSRATTYKDLQKKFVESKIEYMMVNWREYARFAEKCGILPIDPVPPRFRDVFSKGKARTGVPLAHLKPNELQILSEFSRQCLKPQWRMGDQYLVWHVKCEQ